jgi:hypothetical protein
MNDEPQPGPLTATAALEPRKRRRSFRARKRLWLRRLPANNKRWEAKWSFLMAAFSFVLEIAIIVLILLELRGSNEQEKALKQLQVNSAKQELVLEQLQENSVEQEQTLQNLQTSSEDTAATLEALVVQQGKATQATIDQLRLFQRGEGEQAKKPKLVLNTASGPRSYGPVVMGRSNDLVVYDPNKILVAVTNEGDATANNGLLLMTFESQFKIVVLNPPSSPGLTSEGGIMKVIQIPFNNLRVGVPLFITLKFEGDYRSRPKPSEGIFLSFEATADKLPPSVPLGGITLKFR